MCASQIQPVYYSDAEISEQLDQLLEPGEPSLRAEASLIKVLRHQAFKSRVMATFDPNQGFFRFPPSDKSAQEFEDFAAGRRRLALLPGWTEVSASELEGGKDMLDGIRALAKFLKLKEARALQVFFSENDGRVSYHYPPTDSNFYMHTHTGLTFVSERSIASWSKF